MSRRVSAIQRMITQTVRTRPVIITKLPIVIPTQRERDADGEQQRLQARAGEMDLLARGRDGRVERAHET